MNDSVRRRDHDSQATARLAANALAQTIPAMDVKELPRHWYATTQLSLVAFAFGAALVACSFAAWWLMLLPTGESIRSVIAFFYDRWTLAFGLIALAVGLGAWARAWRRGSRILPLVALLGGIACIAVTGYREMHAPAAAMPQALHAVVGIGAVLLIVLGIATAPRAFGPLAELFGVESESARLARVVRIVAYGALALGLTVPFAPSYLGDTLSPAWSDRIAAAGALLFAIPLGVVAIAAILYLRALRRGERRVPICIGCGYPRPAGETCPECGKRP